MCILGDSDIIDFIFTPSPRCPPASTSQSHNLISLQVMGPVPYHTSSHRVQQYYYLISLPIKRLLCNTSAPIQDTPVQHSRHALPHTSSPPTSGAYDSTEATSSMHNLEHAAKISKRDSDTLRELDENTTKACNAMQACRLLSKKIAKEGDDITAHLLEFKSLWEHINQTYPSFKIQDNFELCLKVAISLPPSWEPFPTFLLDGMDKEHSNTHDFIIEYIRENEKHKKMCSKNPVYEGNAQANATC